ncbi:ABC transporter permease [Methyloglobulus sp.]|uniref:ABC transporter permease n=1 Tax=Methyloglobulus sp. TaxID=2518622 RepID=UPI003988CBC0
MAYFSDSISVAIQLILKFDPNVYEIVWTSLKISLIATTFSGLLGVLLGIWVGIKEFIGKSFIRHALNTLMAMPTVMIGLIFYGLLSRKGSLGEFGLLYTEDAVILGEACLILPIIMNMTLLAVDSADKRMLTTLKTLGAKTHQQIILALSELRYVISAGIITGFGRAIGEVGAAMMLGGNIQGTTRTMTTAIAMETGKGDFELGLALGILLLLIALTVNLLFHLLKNKPEY